MTKQQSKVAVSFLADKIYLINKYEELGNNIILAHSKQDITEAVLESFEFIQKLDKRLKERKEKKE